MKKILNREFIACSSLSQMSLIGVVAWSGFAHPSDANAAVINVQSVNFFDGDFVGSFTSEAPPTEVGGALLSAQETTMGDGSTFWNLVGEAVTGVPLVPNQNSPSSFSYGGIGVFDMTGNPVLSELGGVGFFYWSIDGIPQTMTNPFNIPQVQFAPYPTDPSIQALLFPVNTNTDTLHTVGFGTQFVEGMGFLGSTPGSPASGAFGPDTGFFDLIGLSVVKGDIDRTTVGITFTPVPEPSSSVLLVSAFGLLLARRRR